MHNHIEELIERLEKTGERLKGRSCIIGFDGYIDRIVRVVKSSATFDEPTFFSSIPDFAEYLRAASGRSVDLRVVCQDTRVGGNGPIMAAALAKMGMGSVCIGAFGEEERNPVFNALPAACETICIGEPGYTNAYEFDDGKIMFGDTTGFDRITWEALKQRIGLARLRGMLASSDLIGVMNWSALPGTEAILRGILDEALPGLEAKALSRKYLAIDLADPSARSATDMASLFGVLGSLSSRMKLVLFLNEKEARIICRSLGAADGELPEICETIYRRLSPDSIQIHSLREAVGMDAKGFRSIKGAFIEKPTVTTGGGDNFNAGFAIGLLQGFPLEDCLLTGNATAACFVSTGTSPSCAELIDFIKNRASQGDYA
jgi:hypothetical protein